MHWAFMSRALATRFRGEPYAALGLYVLGARLPLLPPTTLALCAGARAHARAA